MLLKTTALGASLLMLPLAAAAQAPSAAGIRAVLPGTHARAKQARPRRPHSSSDCSSPGSNAFLGGGTSNSVFGDSSGIAAGNQNVVCDSASTIGGGFSNEISSGGGNYAFDSFIGAGAANAITDGGSDIIGSGAYNGISGEAAGILSGTNNKVAGDYGFIGAGGNNAITSSNEAAIGGGDSNTIVGQNTTATAAAGGSYGFIGAGMSNSILGTFEGAAQESVIGGGSYNNVNASLGVIAGGTRNTVSGPGGAIGGGEGNTASGNVSTVPGGYHNFAVGSGSFAAGTVAEALTNGSFVWSDQAVTTLHVRSTHPNQFVARATGGVEFFSNPAMTAGVSLAPGSGTWSSLSDRNLKIGIVPLDGARILDKLAALPVSEWSYSSERGVRHIGPMAQDFYAAFGVGEDDRHITTIDEDGVALAAVKALHAENAALRAKNSSLGARVAGLETGQAALQRELEALRAELSRRAGR
jgi:hypothetical protein